MRVALRLRLVLLWFFALALASAICGVLEALGEFDPSEGVNLCLYAAGIVLAALGVLAYCKPPSLSLSSWAGALRAQVARDVSHSPEGR